MIEQADKTDMRSGASAVAQPLPRDFDDLLDRLARDAQERRAVQQSRVDLDG